MKRIAHGAVAMLLALTGRAHAEVTPSSLPTLEWSRSPEAESCPDREALIRTMAERLGRDAFAPSGSRVISLDLDRHEQRWQAEIRVHDASGASVGSQILSSRALECTELFEATVTALAVMLDTAPPVPEEAASRPDPDPTPPAPPAAPPPAAPPPPPAPPTAPARPPASPTPQAFKWVGTVEVGGAFPLVSAANGVCTAGSDFTCYHADGSEFRGSAHPSVGNQIESGVGAPSLRLVSSFERLLRPEVGSLLRVGLVATGPFYRWYDPLQIEFGGRYWFGSDAKSSRVFLEGTLGLGNFYTVIPVTVLDCASGNDAAATGSCMESAASTAVGTTQNLDAVRRSGWAFGSLSIGGLLRFGEDHGMLLRAALLSTFPDPGFVVMPSVGIARIF